MPDLLIPCFTSWYIPNFVAIVKRQQFEPDQLLNEGTIPKREDCDEAT